MYCSVDKSSNAGGWGIIPRLIIFPFSIDRGLFLGSLEAATDVILLESNAITHIVTVDSVPLPRKITSMMPRIAILHLQVMSYYIDDVVKMDFLVELTNALPPSIKKHIFVLL